MLRKTSEIQHNTPADVVAYLATTVQIADDAELTPEDRAVLLPRIFDSVAAKQIQYEQSGMMPNLAIPRG